MALAATSPTSSTILRLMVAARNKAPVWCVRNYSRASCHCIFLASMSMVEGWNGAFSGRRIAREASEPGNSNLLALVTADDEWIYVAGLWLDPSVSFPEL